MTPLSSQERRRRFRRGVVVSILMSAIIPLEYGDDGVTWSWPMAVGFLISTWLTYLLISRIGRLLGNRGEHVITNPGDVDDD